MHSGLWWLGTTIPEELVRKGWDVYSYHYQEKLTKDTEAEARRKNAMPAYSPQELEIIIERVGGDYLATNFHYNLKMRWKIWFWRVV